MDKVEQVKKPKVRDIIRQIQKEDPVILTNDNFLLSEVWLREGCTQVVEIVLNGSSAGTILRARNYILKHG